MVILTGLSQMKRQKPKSDNRLNWRDLNMPVIRKGYRAGRVVDMEVAPEFVQQYYINKLNNPEYIAPQYKNDPTYELRIQKTIKK